jgi:hypothetical protein
MSCKSCKSQNQRNLSAEVAIHFPGLKGLDKPIVWVFPKVLVCLDCRFTEFGIPETELRRLQEIDSTALSLQGRLGALFGDCRAVPLAEETEIPARVLVLPDCSSRFDVLRLAAPTCKYFEGESIRLIRVAPTERLIS